MTGDRRPIRARSRPLWIAVAARLARVGVSANTISIGGMLAGTAAGIALALTPQYPQPWPRVLWLVGAALIALRLVCNMLDGMVAMNSGTTSPVGELYNEVPDRVSDAATLIGLGYAAASAPRLGYLAAILALLVAYVRAAARVAGAPQDFRGPMAKQQRMFVVIFVAAFCGLAPGAWQPEVEEHGWSAPVAGLLIIIIGCVLTIVRRLTGAARALRTTGGPTP